MTVTQKNSRSQRTTKSSKTKKTVLPQVSGTAIESSQLVNGQDALAVSPMWNSESDTIMDLQAYYLLAADLLEKVEVDYAQDESLIQITSRLWQEWQECYPYDAVPQQAGRSLITRLNLIKALRLVYNIKSAFDDLSRSSLKKVANWTKNLLDLLSDKFAEGKFMNSSACINILVELKRLFVYCELASGVEAGDHFRNYRKPEARAFIDSEFQVATLSYIPSALQQKVAELLLEAGDRIASNVEVGNIALETVIDFPDLVEKLRLFFVRIFNDINSYSLPELHPDFEAKNSSASKPVEEEGDFSLSNAQVATILTAMKKIPGSASIIDLRALDEFMDGENWTNTHGKKLSSGSAAEKKTRLGGMWTQEETDALEKGMEMFGNDWKTIKNHFSETLKKRSNVNLKDRARNVKKKRKKEGLPLGIWDLACG